MAQQHDGLHGTGRGFVAAAAVLLALLLAMDAVFIYYHLWLAPYEHQWDLEYEGSYSETFQHLKWLGACILLLGLAYRRQAKVYLASAAIFLYFLVDDSTSVHERVGGWLRPVLGLVQAKDVILTGFPGLNLQARDIGEFLFALVAAAGIAAVLALSWPPPEARRERKAALLLVAWLGLFAFFAVGLDMAHVATDDPVALYMLGVVEDGGEMVCASVLVAWLALELARG